jgi:hypothetical protein
LPIGKLGKGRFVIPWSDRDAAKRLVDSIVQQPLRNAVRDDAHIARENPLGRIPDPEKVRMELIAPGVGLILTGILGFVSTMALSLAKQEALPFFFFSWWAVPCLVIGAIQMMRLRSYPLVVAAMIVAMVPWSPAFVLGLPFGIWSWTLLRRPEIKAAFFNNRRAARSPTPKVEEPRSPARGKMASFFRSVVGYMLPTSVGQRPPSEPDVGAGDVQGQPAPAPR